mgnify:CR=1 FL=1
MTQVRRPDAFNRWQYVPTELVERADGPAERELLASALEKLAADKQRAAKVQGTVARSFLAINSDASGPPLFWCFNNWSEPHLLAAQLPSNIPLYAFVSTHLYVEDWKVKGRLIDSISKMLIEDFDALGLSVDTLGGNCQGAPIAESIAIQMRASKRHAPRLITLDYAPRRAYRGPYTLVFGEKSRFNVFNDCDDPVSLWRQRGMQPDIRVIEDGHHGRYFLKPAIHDLAAIISELTEAAAKTNSNSGLDQVLRLAKQFLCRFK